MRNESDQVLARRQIEFRDNGCSYGSFLRNNIKGYLFLIASYVLLLALSAFLQHWILFYVLLGGLVGSLSRDVGWMRGARKRWAFSVKITDWEKVQRLADWHPS
jgi:hypothetical protein